MIGPGLLGMFAYHVYVHKTQLTYYSLVSSQWRTVMAYFDFVLSPNGDESLNKFLTRDPDHPRGRPSRGHTSCVKNQVNRSNSF